MTIRKLREPGSAVTHLIALILTLAAAGPLIRVAGFTPDRKAALTVFVWSMATLYLASTLFHAICASPRSSLHLQRFDHASIYLLIAGSYTPICVISLDKPYGYELLAVVWTIGLAGILATLFVRHFPKWISAVIYIAMGWMAAFSLPRLAGCLSIHALSWLVAGGIVYTIGGIIYALKMENFNRRHPNFGNHEIFHLFVMAGSFCHFVMMFLL